MIRVMTIGVMMAAAARATWAVVLLVAGNPQFHRRRNDQQEAGGHENDEAGWTGNQVVDHQNLYPTANVLIVSIPGVLPAA